MGIVTDFVPGDVLETRRGGVDVLRHLARELATLERNGSIQIVRNIPEVGRRVGHLLIFDGSLAAAFHQGDANRVGIEALLEIESDASALDAQMSLHEMTESSYVSTLSDHPEANLMTSSEEAQDEAWWTAVRSPRRVIEREERLPDVKPNIGVPEALRRKSEARLKNQGGPVLMRGQAWLEHSIEADEVFRFASALGEMKQANLLITRHPPSRIESEYDIKPQHYRWLSETQHERTLEPSLESIRRTVDEFFVEHRQCVLLLEGIEYLSGIHGEQRVIEMMRSIVDQTRLEGNILIVSSNLEAFTLQHRTRLEREFTKIKNQQLQVWLLDVELLEQHPYFSDIDEEMEAAIVEHLEANVEDPAIVQQPEIIPSIEPVPLPVEHRTMPVDDELKSKMHAWASDTEEDNDDAIEPIIEPPSVIEDTVIEVKPRTPQRIVRKRKTTRQTIKQNPIDAAAQRSVEIPKFKSVDSKRAKPFVPMAAEIHQTLPKPKSPVSQRGIDHAAASPSRKRQAKFPPIKSRKRIAVPLPRTEQIEATIQPSPHAREHASAQQRVTEQPDSEDDA